MARRQADDRGLRQQLERLYALPPASFTAARQELAARLRGEGRRQDAAAVKALRRPTPASWAVNRLLRLEPRRFKGLLAAGRQARRAQRRALAGKGATAEAAGELRESLRAAKRLVEELRQRGLEMLGPGRGGDAAPAGRAARLRGAGGAEPGARGCGGPIDNARGERRIGCRRPGGPSPNAPRGLMAAPGWPARA